MWYMNYILNDLGSAIFLPCVMMLLGLILGMKLGKAFSASLTLGVALLGMGMVINFMAAGISPAATGFVERTGLTMEYLDVGWSPIAAIVWTWEYGMLMFPLQIVINMAMLAFGLTSCLNVDLWNVWNKVFTGFIIFYFTQNLLFAFIGAAIEVVLELINADATQRRIYKLTGIPGIACPHSMMLGCIYMHPVYWFLKKIVPESKKLTTSTLREKIGVLGENHVVGFIVGTAIGLIGGQTISQALNTGVNTGAALMIFPMVAKLFMTALAPISDACGDFMKKRFPGKTFYIGLDWPFLASLPEAWLAQILLVPVVLILAVVLPGNTVLPVAGVLAGSAFVTLVLCEGDLIKMLIIGALYQTLYYWAASMYAPAITELATKNNLIDPANTGKFGVSWVGMECPELRMTIINFFQFNALGIGLAVLTVVLGFWYFKSMFADEKKYAEELGY